VPNGTFQQSITAVYLVDAVAIISLSKLRLLVKTHSTKCLCITISYKISAFFLKSNTKASVNAKILKRFYTFSPASMKNVSESIVPHYISSRIFAVSLDQISQQYNIRGKPLVSQKFFPSLSSFELPQSTASFVPVFATAVLEHPDSTVYVTLHFSVDCCS